MLTRKWFSLVAICLMAISHSLFSQITLDGIVTDNGSEPVKNALVELSDKADSTRVFSDYTDDSGRYTIQIAETGIDDPKSRNPKSYRLMQNYPNPFNPSTIIAYELSRPSHVRIEVRNILGQKVKTLFDGFQSNLSGRMIWDGSDNSGRGVSAGVYVYSLNVEGHRINRKMLLMEGGGHSTSAPSSSMATGGSGLNVLNKPMSNLYRLRITGENIEAFEKEDLTITGDTTLNVTVMRTVNFEDPPFNLGGIDAQFARNVPYGPYEDNVFDIFLADATAPTPLVIYIHGGGFKTGHKGEIYLTNRDEILGLLYRGVSFATINYRLLEECDDEGVIKSLSDSRRCLQFLRYHHEQLNVDPSRVAVYGASAGAGTSIWLAFSDDMADPNADDPVLRESTRVTAAVARATQATYDLLKWETVVFVSLGLTLADMGELWGFSEQGCVLFYGADSLEQLGSPEFQAYRASVDMLALMTPDDPPIWVRNNIENVGIPTEETELMHHVLHAVALSERAAEVGVECVLYIPPLNIADPTGEGVVEFLLRQFGIE